MPIKVDQHLKMDPLKIIRLISYQARCKTQVLPKVMSTIQLERFSPVVVVNRYIRAEIFDVVFGSK